MAFNLKESAILVRNLLSEQSPALVGLGIPRIQAIIPIALEDYARNSFSDARKRQQFKTKVTVTLAAGKIDLTTVIDGTANKIYLPDLPKTTVYKTSGDIPFTWVGSREQLFYSRVGSSDSPACFLDGYILYTKNTSAALLAESIYFVIPVFPSTVTAIPTTLQKDFLLHAANFIRSQFQPAGVS